MAGMPVAHNMSSGGANTRGVEPDAIRCSVLGSEGRGSNAQTEQVLTSVVG